MTIKNNKIVKFEDYALKKNKWHYTMLKNYYNSGLLL